MTLKDTLETHPIIVLFSLAVASFSAGYGAREAIIKGTGQELVLTTELAVLLEKVRHIPTLEQENADLKARLAPYEKGSLCAGQHRIILFSTRGDHDQRLIDMMDKLVSAGCSAQIPRHATLQPASFPMSEVRWFHAEDRSFALAVASFLRDRTRLGLSTRDVRDLGSQAPLGQLEVWLN